MTDREKMLIALREKPLKIFEIMKRVNIKHQDDCQSLLLKMRDDGAVKFDIHKGHWLSAWHWAGRKQVLELRGSCLNCQLPPFVDVIPYRLLAPY